MNPRPAGTGDLSRRTATHHASGHFVVHLIACREDQFESCRAVVEEDASRDIHRIAVARHMEGQIDAGFFPGKAHPECGALGSFFEQLDLGDLPMLAHLLEKERIGLLHHPAPRAPWVVEEHGLQAIACEKPFTLMEELHAASTLLRLDAPERIGDRAGLRLHRVFHRKRLGALDPSEFHHIPTEGRKAYWQDHTLAPWKLLEAGMLGSDRLERNRLAVGPQHLDRHLVPALGVFFHQRAVIQGVFKLDLPLVAEGMRIPNERGDG